MLVISKFLVMFISLIATVAFGAEPCREGEKRLRPNEECIPAPLFNYLYCLEQSGGGRIEISRKRNADSSIDLEILLKGKGSGVVLKGEGSGRFTTSESAKTARELHEKLDPTLAAKCEKFAHIAVKSGGSRPKINKTNVKVSNNQAPPIASNIIADFKGSKGTGALTSFGLQFSMMSDSSLNMGSKIWYERVPDVGQIGGGFIRVYYEMLPQPGREGFVGIYADFTPPPEKPVSLLGYQGIYFKMRVRQEIDNIPEIRVVLYSDNVNNPQYAYPIARVYPDKEWRDYYIPFSKFESPPHAISPVQLDAGRVFRFAFVFVSDSKIHGHVDIREIKLF